MERWSGKIAIVTGASSGIGEAISELLVKHGVSVVGIARREDKLKEIGKKLSGEKSKFYPLKADITKEEEILNVFKWTEINLGAIHIMINNAGMTNINRIEEQGTDVWRQMYDTNLIALQIFCKEAVKSMKRNNVHDGHIINISSVIGHMSSPFAETVNYYATKKAVLAFTEGLRIELTNEGSNIGISTISPGITDTEIFKAHQEKIPPEILKLGLKPSDVAEAVIFALQVPQDVNIQSIIMQSKTNVWKLIQDKKYN